MQDNLPKCSPEPRAQTQVSTVPTNAEQSAKEGLELHVKGAKQIYLPQIKRMVYILYTNERE